MQPIEIKECVVEAVEDMQGVEPLYINVRALTSVTEYMCFVTGTSSRHVKAIAHKVIEVAKQKGLTPLGVEGLEDGEWVLVDLGDAVVHVMLPNTRTYYDLERLWTNSETDVQSDAHS